MGVIITPPDVRYSETPLRPSYTMATCLGNSSTDATEALEYKAQEEPTIRGVVLDVVGGVLVFDPLAPHDLHTITAVVPLHTRHLVEGAIIGVVVEDSPNDVETISG